MSAHINITWPDDDNAKGVMRWPYAAGFLARRAVAQAVAYGRSLGLQVDDFNDGGWVKRSGHLVAEGRAGDLRRFANALERISED